MPKGLATPGYSYWRAVELTLRFQWYIVALRERTDGGWIQRDLLVSWTSDLLAVVRTGDRTTAASIQVIQPVGRSGMDSWSVVDVTRIWMAIHTADHDRQITVFETSNGDRFCDPMERVSASALSSYALVWQEP